MRLWSTLLWLVLAHLVLPGGAGKVLAQDPVASVSPLYQSHWRGSVLGQSQSGELCWLMGPDGSLRLEILFLAGAQENAALSAQSPLEDLLQQRGHGYCLVLGEGADGTFNPWGEPWQRLDNAVASWLIPLAEVLATGPDFPAASLAPWREITTSTRNRAPATLRWRIAQGHPAVRTWQAELPALERVIDEPGVPLKPATFRSASVERGMGRGGSAEILRLNFLPGSPGSWALTTSRKPGRLELTVPRLHAVQPPGLEAFAPLWPLADLLIFDDK